MKKEKQFKNCVRCGKRKEVGEDMGSCLCNDCFLKENNEIEDWRKKSITDYVEIGYRKGFIDGYNLSCPRGEEATEEDFDDLFTPAIEKAKDDFLSRF